MQEFGFDYAVRSENGDKLGTVDIQSYIFHHRNARVVEFNAGDLQFPVKAEQCMRSLHHVAVCSGMRTSGKEESNGYRCL